MLPCTSLQRMFTVTDFPVWGFAVILPHHLHGMINASDLT